MILRYSKGVSHVENVSMDIKGKEISFFTLTNGQKLPICEVADFFTKEQWAAVEHAALLRPVPKGLNKEHTDAKVIQEDIMYHICLEMAEIFIDRISQILVDEQTTGIKTAYRIENIFNDVEGTNVHLDNGKIRNEDFAMLLPDDLKKNAMAKLGVK